ncbi:MAG: DUF3417 domain-containing protein, partial [Muribaculaceae bacterium]|nr:DUF3417 domain-containing protein [Muribaculaceae bacterium]
MNGVLNFSVLDGWWYEGYRFDEKAGWALTDKRTYQDQAQQDKLDAATIYSMLENEIIPLYFAKNSKGYSPEWIQYIKGSIGHIAPHFTMQRMIEDYIERFYDPEGKRSTRLAANDFALAKEIAAWKEKVAAAWPGIKVLDIKTNSTESGVTGAPYQYIVTVDTNGLGSNLGLEQVIFRVQDGEEKLAYVAPFKIVKQDGGIVTFELNEKVRDAGVFRCGLRLYPSNPELPHRMDFAFTRWL